MPEKRRVPRIKKRLPILIDRARPLNAAPSSEGSTYTGFTYDFSATGIFVRAMHTPPAGSPMKARLALPDGNKISLRGKVVRAFWAPPSLRHLVPSGFCLRFTESPPEDYFRFLESLSPVKGSHLSP